MKIFTLIISVYLLVSCSHTSIETNQPQANTQSDSTNQIKKFVEGKTLQKLSSPTGKIKLPAVKDFGVFVLIRNSDNKDKSG